MVDQPLIPVAADGRRGYALLTVILVGALVAAMTLGYARHVIVAGESEAATLDGELSESAIGSGFHLARQTLAADTARNRSTRLGGGLDVDVAVSDAGDELRAITVATGARSIEALAEVYPAVGDDLPTLSYNANRAVWESPNLIDVTSDTAYSDTEIDGILLLRKGVDIVLDDVIVRGSIVTENALSDTLWSAGEETSITVTGGLLVEPGSTLSGCAVIGPDCTVTGTTTSALQLHGVVVARALNLSGVAALHRQVATTTAPSLSADVDFPGAGRAPRPWPTALTVPGESIARIVFPFGEAETAERDSIQAYRWPDRLREGATVTRHQAPAQPVDLEGTQGAQGAQNAQGAQGAQGQEIAEDT